MEVLLLFVMVIMFYFQLYPESAITAGAALIGCLAVGGWTLFAGENTYGLGLLGGTLLGLVVGFYLLFSRIERLEYRTFSSQPMAEEKPFEPRMLAASGGFGTYYIRGGVKQDVPKFDKGDNE